MTYEQINLDFKDNVALLTLNQPEVLNAISNQMIGELYQVMDEIQDPAVGARCLLITGQGRGFCAEAHIGSDGVLDEG